MDNHLLQIAELIRGMREILYITTTEMSRIIGISEDEYVQYESGTRDFTFTFLYTCANRFDVDMMELLTGEPPRLRGYTLTRAGEGLNIKRREGFLYENMAALFRERLAQPVVVTAPYREEEQNRPISLSSHDDQEFDYILEGQLKFVYDGHTEIMNPGDAVYYDSNRGHGMIAYGGKPCKFLAMVIRRNNEK
jgi:mannose-6-phosphate isomerase-like protein (cupin superfamily)